MVTLIVALVALLVYNKQRTDRRRDAAGIILREIIGAERQIPKARESINTMKGLKDLPKEKVQVMPVSSWETSQHYLANVLPQDTLELISDFYANCHLLDESLVLIDSSFYDNVQQVRINQFRVGAKFVEERVRGVSPNNDNDPKVTKKNREVIDESLRLQQAFDASYPTSTSYYSEKIVKDAEEFLGRLPRGLSQNRVGDKLRRARRGFFGRLFHRKEL